MPSRASVRAGRLAAHVLPAVAPASEHLAPSIVHGSGSALSADDLAAHFLEAPAGFAVAGASAARSKYGNKVLRCFYQHGKAVVPISEREPAVEGLASVRSLGELPGGAKGYGLCVVTPPEVTLGLLREAKAQGCERVWLQEGAESAEVLALAAELGLSPVHSGPCLLRRLGFDDAWEPPRTLAEGVEAEGAVRWRIDNGFVMTVTLSNPRKRNPLARPVLLALRETLRRAEGEERERVRAVVLESEGPTFSSGHDFADFLADRGAEAHAETLSLCSSVNVALQRIPQPTIAVVQGLATAGGCQLACSCDLVVASTSSAFELPGARSAGFCHTPAVSVAARAASPRFALELALLADPVPAERAREMGLVNRVVAPADLRGEGRRLAEQIARISPARNMQLGKQAFYAQLEKATLEERYAAVEPVMLGMFADPVYQTSMNRFLNKGKQKKQTATLE